MTPRMRDQVMKIVEEVLTPEELERINSLELEDTGFGYDKFGLEKETASLAFIVANLLYKYYFRVQSKGIENVPSEGRVIMASNHSGVMPFDGMMIGIDNVINSNKPRMTRGIMDLTGNNLPFSGVFLRRVGQVIGTRKNFEELMKMEQLVLVFPEGAKGSGKMFWERYNLKTFNVGHVEFSLKYKAPIVPVAVIGGEEQMPNLYNVKQLADALGTSMIPITLNLLLFGPLGMIIPFPTKYGLSYGEPIRFYEDYPEDAVKDPDVVRKMADKVQNTVQGMIDEGLSSRKGIFT